MAQHPAVRAQRQPPPDLAVEPVPLPLCHRDVTGERVEQADILRRCVADLPAEAPQSHVGEQAGGLDLGGEVRECLRRGVGPALRQSLTDLVVDVLDVAEERVAVRRDHVDPFPEGQVAAGPQQLPRLAVPDLRVDPVPRGRGEDQVECRVGGRAPGLEVRGDHRHPLEPGEIAPCLAGERRAQFHASDLKTAPRERDRRLPAGTADLEEPGTRFERGHGHESVEQFFRVLRTRLLIERRRALECRPQLLPAA